MVTIRIADHVHYASTYQDGQVIYDLIAPRLVQGETVALSFDGFPAVPSAFVNAALVQLLDVLSLDKIKAQLQIRDSTKYINELVKRRLQFVASLPSTGPSLSPIPI